MKIINSSIAPIKVIKDKTYEIIARYILVYIFGANVEDSPEITRFYSRISTYEQLVSFFEPPTHIIDNIYLGNAYNAAYYYGLKKNNIKMIINVTKEISKYYPEYFTYYQYELYDNNHDNIKDFLDDANKNIKDFQENKKGNILIHCFMGASRSASVVLYYLMKNKINEDTNKLYTLNEALIFIKNKRPIVNPTNKLLEDLNSTINK